LKHALIALLLTYGSMPAMTASTGQEPAPARDTWDLATCRAVVHPGHLCTPEHLDADLVVLTANAVAFYNDPDFRARSVKDRRALHIANAETVPDPRTDPMMRSMLHSAAETGLLETETALKRAEAAFMDMRKPLVSSDHESLWRAIETVALKGIKSISVSVEDSHPADDICRPTSEALRLAAIRPILDGGIKIVSDDLVSPTLDVNVTAFSTRPDGCAGFLSVSLRNESYVSPTYQHALPAFGNLLLMSPWPGDESAEQPVIHSVAVSKATIQLAEAGSLLTGPRSGFASRIADQLRRTVDNFVTQIKLANQSP
jgi:hypothetical protein